MRTKFNGILTLLLALVVQVSFAQDRTISGTVSDESGPLPGVTILKKGTTQGTETDFDGNYSIKAKTGDVLVFSFVGMKTAERTVGASNSVSVVLETDNLLEEVVVVGYGTTTKQAYTGTAKVVKTEQLEAKSVSNVTQALAGEVAGVTVLNTSGQPGAAATVRIRGFGSVNGNRSPLYVVDGAPFFGSINSINPSDIESTTILKDATATAIYGSRGANGVILINTKSGKNGRNAIEVDVKTGVNFSHLPRYSKIESPEEYAELAWHSLYNNGDADGVDPVAFANANLFSGAGINPKYNLWNGAAADIINPTTGKFNDGVTRKYDPENWEDYGFQTSIRTEANVKFTGGDDKTKYFSSFGYLDDKGYIINSSYKRYSARLNLEHKPKEWLTAAANIGYSYGTQKTNGQSEDSGSVFWFADNIPSIYPLFLRDDNGNTIADTKFPGNNIYDYGIGRGFGALTNSIADATYDLNRSNRHSLNGNFSFTVDLTDNLSFQTRYGAQFYNLIDDVINNPFYGSAEGQGGSLFKANRNLITQNFLQMLTYENSFGDHNLKVLVAHESNDYKRKRNTLSATRVVNLNNGLDDPGNYVNSSGKPGGYTEAEKLESYFGQVNYNYLDKYFLSGSVRRDGSSRFANNKWGTFGSVGAGWIVSKEDFMQGSNTFNNLKLKASYGIIGDQAGVGFFQGQGGYSINVDANGEISLPLLAVDNPAITWESAKMFQVGAEFTLFNNVIDGTVDYYVKNTDDLIFQRRIPPSSGDALITVNDGLLRNTGIEFDLTAHIINKEDYTLDLTVNGEALDNEMIKMPIDPSTGEQKVIDQVGSFGRAVGYSIFDYYMREWAGVDPADGAAMWYVNYHDANANGIMDEGEAIGNLTEYQTANPDNAISETVTKTYQNSTQRYVGKSAIPKLRGAFRLSARVHNFDVSSQFGYSLGGYAYDNGYAGLMRNEQAGGNNWHTDIRDSWKQPGDITNVPRLFSNRETNVSSASTRFLTSTDYLTLNNVRVGYSLPSRLIENSGVSNVNIWLSGDNLFILSARDGFNPSTSETGSSSTYRYTPLTTLALGVRVKF